MKQILLVSKENFRIEEVPKPVLKEGEVLVKVMAAGICSSDIPRYVHGKNRVYPIVLGHEFSGKVVDACGDDVKRFVGKRVSVAPLLPCHKCDVCLAGDYALCKRYSFIGSRVQGAFAEYVAVPSTNLVDIGDLAYEPAALLEPASVALHGLLASGYAGEDIAVIGPGTIGVFVAQWAKILGAKKVTLIGRNKVRLDNALKLGIENVVESSDESLGESQRFSFVVDAVGSDETLALSLQVAKQKGKMCIIGTPSKESVNIGTKDFEEIQRKELTLFGSWMSYSKPFPGKEWEMAKEHFRKGDLKYDGLIHKRISLEEVEETFKEYAVPGNISGKTVIVFDE